MRNLVLAILGTAAIAAVPQSETGSIEGRVVRPSSEAIAGAQIVAEGPISMTVGGRWAPNPALTPEMRAEIEQFILSRVVGTPLEQVADTAARREALLLGLPEPPRPQGATSRTLLPQRTTTTDASGRFSFKNLVPGTYRVQAVRAGHFGLAAPGAIGNQASYATATLEVLRDSAEVRLVMEKGGAISGTVRGADGQAVADVTVRPYKISYQDTFARLLPSGNSQQSNDRGAYRLFDLPSGEYVVSVVVDANGRRPQDRFLTTFHPAALDGRDARSVTVADGAEVAGVDFLLQLKPANTISGRVNNLPATDINGRPLTANTLHLLTADSSRLVGNSPALLSSARDSSNGRFELRGVAPGRHLLMSCVNDSAGRIFSGRTPIDVGAGDLTGVTIDLQPAVEVRVRLTVDGAPPPFTMGPPPPANADGPRPQAQQTLVPRPSISLTLRSLEPYAGSLGAAIPQACSSGAGTRRPQVQFDAAGIYAFDNTPVGRYTIAVTGLPPKAYVADMRIGSNDAGNGFVVGAQPVQIEVTVKTNGRSLEGTVRDANDRPFGSARVALLPNSQREDTSRSRTAVSDSAGRFSFQGIAPGDYTLFAWKAVSNNAWMNAEFLKPFEDRGVRVTISGESARVDVRVIE